MIYWSNELSNSTVTDDLPRGRVEIETSLLRQVSTACHQRGSFMNGFKATLVIVCLGLNSKSKIKTETEGVP